MAHKYVDFSSDDDFGSSAKKKAAYKRRSLGGPIYNREYFMNEILGYTDEELFQHLKRYNFDCGPVSGSTRKVYQKKLADKMVEGPPPPPPKMQRRSMGTFRSLPTKLPDPSPEDDFISGSSGSDIEGEYREVEPDMPQGKTAHANLVQEKHRPSDANHKGSGNYAKKANPSESMLPTIQLRRLEREDRSTPPPPPPPPEEEAPKHPPKIQPMHREKVKPKPRPNASKESASQEEVSIWVQVFILVICLFVTALFLKYIESTETLPIAPDLTVDPPVTPNIHGQFQHETTYNQTDTPPQAPTTVSEEESENKFIPVDPKPDKPPPTGQKPDKPPPTDQKPDIPSPTDQKPDDSPLNDQKPVDSPPTDQKTDKPSPTDQKPVDSPPTDQKTDKPLPADQKTDKPSPTDQKPDDSPLNDQKPVDSPPTDQKTDKPLPADQKSVESPVKDQPTNTKASIKGKEKSKIEKSKDIPS